MNKHGDPEKLKYRWVVLVSSFLVRFLVFGSLFSVGVLYVEWLNEFQTTKGSTAWIGSIATGSCLLIGPVASALISQIGSRRTVVVGGVVMATGMILSAFAPNIFYLFFTYGLLAGCGGGITNLAAVVRINDYFVKQRALAMGVGSSGVGLGAFAFAVFQQQLLDLYGWRGSVLIVGGICLNICAAGMLMIHPKHLSSMKKQTRDSNSNKKVLNPNEAVCILQESDVFAPNDRRSEQRRESDSSGETEKLSSRDDHDSDNQSFQTFDHEFVVKEEDRSLIAKSEKATAMYEKSPERTKLDDTRDIEMQIMTSNGLKSSAKSLTDYEIGLNSYEIEKKTKSKSSSPNPTAKSLRRKSSVFQRLILKMRFAEQTKSLWRDPVFILLFASDFLSWLVQFVPYVYLPHRAQSLGISPTDSALLVSSMGFSGAVGKLAFGAFCTFSKLDAFKVFTTAQILFGVSTILSPLCRTFAALMVYAVSFGFLSGAYALMMVIPADLVGFERFPAAYGFLLAGEGLGVYLGPPIAGWISDLSDSSYETSFLCAGSALLLSGLILLLRPLAERWRQHLKVKSSKSWTK